jgi:mevalonate kinase
LFGAKIAGSGLGDCVLLLGSEPLDWPHTQMSVQIDPQGLRQETGLPSYMISEKPL